MSRFCERCLQMVTSWSHHTFFSYITVYAYQTLEILFANKEHPIFLSRKYTISRLNWLDYYYYQHQLVLQLSKCKNIESYWFMNSIFCGWMHFEKFHYTFFERWFCLRFCNFQNGSKFRMLESVSIYFRFSHHFTILKTDSKLDCWLPHTEKGA